MPTLTRIQGYIYSAVGEIVTSGHLRITAQQDFISVDGTKVIPFTSIVDLAESDPAGFVDVSVYATEGAQPSGLAYFVEFDPDPEDTTIPIASKNGYWSNYWAVPNTASIIPMGNFVQARRGDPLVNYMPLNGTLDTGADSIYVGAAPGNDTTKTIYAYQGVDDKPAVRYNADTQKWEFSHNGVDFFTFAAEEAVDLNQDTFVLGQAANTTKTIQANTLATNKPAIRFNHTNGKWEFSNDGVNFFIISGTLTIPTADLLNDWLFMVGGV